MTAYACLLRGINLGSRRMRMDDLADAFRSLGHTDVATYIQSGNVVFRADASADVLVPEARELLATRFGFDVPLVVRTSSELEGVLRRNPFTASCREATHLHVAFLPAAPDPDSTEPPAVVPPDELVLDGAEIFLHCPGGLGRSSVSVPQIDRRLRTVATVRNWNTVRSLAVMTAELEAGSA